MEGRIGRHRPAGGEGDAGSAARRGAVVGGQPEEDVARVLIHQGFGLGAAMIGQPGGDRLGRCAPVVEDATLAHHPADRHERLVVGPRVAGPHPGPVRELEHARALHLQEEEVLGFHPRQGAVRRLGVDGGSILCTQGRVGWRGPDRGVEQRVRGPAGRIGRRVVGGQQALGRQGLGPEPALEEPSGFPIAGRGLRRQVVAGLRIARRPQPAGRVHGGQGGQMILGGPAGQIRE